MSAVITRYDPYNPQVLLRLEGTDPTIEFMSIKIWKTIHCKKESKQEEKNAWQSLTGKSIDAIYELYYNSDLSLSLTRSRDYLNLVTATIGKSVASPSLESSCYPKGHLHIWVCKLNYCFTASFNHLLKNLKIQISGGCPVSSVG